MPYAKPGAPAGLSLQNDGARLVWSAPALSDTTHTGVLRYRLRQQVGDGAWSAWRDVDGGARQAAVELTPAVWNRFEVQACNPDGLCGAAAAYAASRPGLPGVLSVGAFADYGRQFTVAWGAAADVGAVSHRLEERSADGAWQTACEVPAGAATECRLNGRAPGGVYSYRVQACNGQLCSAWREGLSVAVPATPGPITAAVEAAVPAYTLSWPDSKPAGGHYRLERFDGQGWVVVASELAEAQRRFDTGLERGRETHYRVSACNAQGVCSAPSPAAAVYVPHLAPAAVAQLRLDVDADGNALDLSWAPAAGHVQRHRVEHSVDGGVSWQALEAVVGSRSEGRWGLRLLGPAAPAAHRLRVAACNDDGGCGPWTQSGLVELPGLPGEVVLSRAADGALQVDWQPAGGTVTRYRVDYRVGEGDWQELVKTAGRQAQLTGPIEGRRYRFRVAACNDGAGCWRAAESNALLLPQRPPGVTLQGDAAAGSLVADWTAPPGSISVYRIAFSADDGQSWSAPVELTDTRHERSGVDPGAHRVRVWACSADAGCAGPSESNRVVLPGSVSGLDAVLEPGRRIALSWQTSGPVEYHRLEVSRDGGPWETLAEPVAAAYGLAAEGGVDYRFRVAACHGDSGCAAPSAPASLSVPLAPPGLSTDAERLEQPIDGRTVYDAGYSGLFSLQWAAPDARTAFVALDERVPAGDWSPFESAAAPEGTRAEHKPANFTGEDQFYLYRGRACRGGACSAETEIGVRVRPYPIPHPPVAFAFHFPEGQAPSAGRYVLSWEAPPATPPKRPAGDPGAERVTHYKLDLAGTAGVEQPAIAHDDTQAAYGFTVEGGEPGRSYDWYIAACFLPDEVGAVEACSDFVGPVTVYIPHAPPMQVTDLVHQPDGADSGRYTLSWAVPGGRVERYEIQTRVGEGAWSAPLAVADSRYEYTAAVRGVEHRHRVRACNADACGPYSAEYGVYVPLRAPGPMAAPQLLDVEAEAGAVRLLWNAPEGVVEDYRLQISADGGQTWSEGETVVPLASAEGGLEHRLSGLAGGTTYRFRLAACNRDSCNAERPPAYGPALEVYLPHAAPAAPTDLVLTVVTEEPYAHRLSWTAAAGTVSHYEVQEWLDGDGAAARTVAAPEQAAWTAEVPRGRTYAYRVRACNADACGPYSDAVERYVPHLAPGAPDALRAAAVEPENGRIRLVWNPPVGVVASYQVEYSGDAGQTWSGPQTVAGALFEAVDLANGEDHHFRLRACNADACGAAAELAVRLPYAAPGVPGALVHQADALDPVQGRVVLEWTAPAADPRAPVSHYRLFHGEAGGGQLERNVPADTPRVELTGLAAGRDHRFWLRACNADACGPATEALYVHLPSPAPAAPAFAATDTDPAGEAYARRQFVLAWSDTPGAVYYELHEDLDPAPAAERWLDEPGRTLATAHVFNNREYGRVYRYRLRACSEAHPLSCSPWVETQVRLKYPRPGVPAGVVVNDVDPAAGTFTLTWNGVLGWAPYRYQLQERVGDGAWRDLVVTERTGHALSGRAAGRYAYRVRACNPEPDADCGDWSAATPLELLPTPGLPEGLALDRATCRVTLQWVPPAGLPADARAQYEIAARPAAAQPWATVAWTGQARYDVLIGPDDPWPAAQLRVRTRWAKDGAWGAWGPWAETALIDPPFCKDVRVGSIGISIEAPPFSGTGQYEVRMAAPQTGPMERRDYFVSVNGGAFGPLLTNGGGVENGMLYSVRRYTAEQPAATGEYRYRFAFCKHRDIPSEQQEAEGCTGRRQPIDEVVEATTLVLPAPGAVAPLAVEGAVAGEDGLLRSQGGTLTLSWPAAADPGPAEQFYELQRRRGGGPWLPLAEPSATRYAVTLTETGVPYAFRVRACRRFAGYLNCGPWAESGTLLDALPAPRFAVDHLPRDGELVVYDRKVPLQWLPPRGWVGAGKVDHYRITVEHRPPQGEDTITLWTVDHSTTVAPVYGDEQDPPVQQAMVEVAQGGTKRFLIRACGGPTADTCGEALVIDLSVVVPPDPPELTDLVGLPDPDALVTPFDGVLAGEFEVTPGGSAAYTLPIVVPPGSGGLAPELTLRYDSSAGNGVAGLGWSLSASSGIAPCPRNYVQDGPGPHDVIIDHDDNDAQCLDGVRLVPVGDGEYRLEKNDFARIERVAGGACGHGYRVRYPTGRTLEYGLEEDACFTATDVHGRTVVTARALNRVVDASGNTIHYRYRRTGDAQVGHEWLLERIEYTGHTSGAKPYTAVHFVYEARPDAATGYRAGLKYRRGQRLVGIYTGLRPGGAAEPESEAYGRYRLRYADAPDEPYSRLVEIGYCAKRLEDAAEQCLKPLSFEWTPYRIGWEALPEEWIPPKALYAYERSAGAGLVDLDNDGLPELVYSSVRHGRLTYRNTGSGWELWESARLPVHFLNGEGKDCGVRFADIDNDGRPELISSEYGPKIGSDVRFKIYEFTYRWQESEKTSPIRFHNGYCEDTGARLVDMDSDGFVDILIGNGYEDGDGDGDVVERSQQVFWNVAGVQWSYGSANIKPPIMTRKRKHITDWRPPGESSRYEWDDLYYDPAAYFIDLNGDGFLDVLYKTLPHSGFDEHYAGIETIEYHGLINNGRGYSEQTAPPVMADVWAFSDWINTNYEPDGGLLLLDLNGDGLTDVMRRNREDLTALINTGAGWERAPYDWVPQLLSLPSSRDAGTAVPRFVPVLDVNADGRSDLFDNGNVYLATDEGWRSDDRFLPPSPFPVSPEKYSHAPDLPPGADILFGDVNGDGRLDYLRNGGGVRGAWTVLSEPPLIRVFADALGNRTEVDYQALTDRRMDGRDHPLYAAGEESVPGLREAPMPLRVVSLVRVGDGLGGFLESEYSYAGLKAGLRGPAGFERMTVYKVDGTVASTRYAQGYPYTGLPLELTVTLADGGQVISRKRFGYCHAVTSATSRGSATDPESPGFTSGVGCMADPYDDRNRHGEALAVLPVWVEEEEYLLDGDLNPVGEPIRRRTDTRYGPWGRPLEATVRASRGGADVHLTRTTTRYATASAGGGALEGAWRGLVAERSVERRIEAASGPVLVAEGTDPIVRSERFAYDAAGRVVLAQVEPDAGAGLARSTAYAYDLRGNLLREVVCEGATCSADGGADNGSLPGRAVSHAYDADGRHRVRTCNALDHCESYVHDHPLGLVTAQTGPNGLTTTFVYDALGRKLSVTDAAGNTSHTRYWRADTGFVPGAAWVVESLAADGALGRIYYDRLGRERRRLARNLHGEWVAVDREYDARGRLLRESAPYFVHGVLAGNRYWTEYRYDRLDRPVAVAVPLGDADNDRVDDGQAVSRSEYAGLTTRTIDPLGRVVEETRDILGRSVRRVRNPGTALEVFVEHQYDAVGNRIASRVDGDEATLVRVHYDRLGRKIRLDDPSLGSWRYRYNAYGELVEQTDAAGNRITQDYDRLGRLVERREEGADGMAVVNTWAYDSAPGAGIGKLAVERSPEAERVLSYDPLGRLERSTQSAGGLSQTLAWEYDALGRVSAIHYPGAEAGGSDYIVRHHYSPYGGLWAVLDADGRVLWRAEAFDARGQLAAETLRNGNFIQRRHDPATGWLTMLASWDGAGQPIQTLRYAYDAVGNMTLRERFMPWILEPDGSFARAEGERRVAEALHYDALDRLRGSALYHDQALVQTREYRYDRLGNLLEKDGRAYRYGDCGGPYTLCGAGEDTFQYDANGNLLSRRGGRDQTLAYTPFNKPRSIEEGGVRVEFGYGPDRLRVTKTVTRPDGQVEQIGYLGLGATGQPLYERHRAPGPDGAERIEHRYFLYAGAHHGGQPFAVHLEVDSEGDGRIDDPDTRYLHRDHLGSVVAVTDEVGLVHDPSGRTRVEPVAFAPFGRRLGPDWLDDPAAARAPGSPGHLDYTGQEALPEVGLIHMNGRLYDPELGRFLAADPFVQAPGEPGNYNRYVYVLNNPLRYSDPTGHLFEDFKDFVITVIIIVVSIECQPCGAALAAGYALYRGAEPWQVVLSFVAGMAGGALASTAGATGLQAAIISGLVSGAITGMITAWVSGGNIARGMVLGAISGAIGGAVNYALQSGVQEVMQPSQPSGGTRGDALEEVIIVDEWEKPDVPRGRTKEISRAELREIEENSPNQEAWKDNVKGIDKLDGLSDKLKPKAESVLKELSEKGYKLRVVWGKRTKAENDALVKEGLASKTSKHLTGDAMGFVNRKLGYDVEKGSDYLKNLKTAADNAGVIWGGDFESRWDPNHIGLK